MLTAFVSKLVAVSLKLRAKTIRVRRNIVKNTANRIFSLTDLYERFAL